MKKGLFILFGLLLTIMLVSCHTPVEKKLYITINNMIFKEEATYYAYFESDVIDINEYVNCNKTYEIIYNENVYSSEEKTSFEVFKSVETFFIKAEDKNFRLDFYKNEMVKISIVLPNGSIFESNQLIGSLYDNVYSLISEEAEKLGYMFAGKVNYEGQNEAYNDVLLTDLQVIEPCKITPICAPKEYEIDIDGTIYKIKTGEIMYFPVDFKLGYTFVGFTNGLVNGQKYDKDLGTKFNTIYVANEYEITYLYEGKTHVAKQVFDENIDLLEIEVEGYDLKGWLYNGEPFTKDVYDLPLDIELTPLLTPKTFKINFTNIDNPYSMDVMYNETFTLPTPEKEGATFLYWSYNGEKFEEEKYSYLENLTLSAVWQEDNQTVSLNLEAFGGSVEKVAPVDLTGKVLLPTPEKTNYKFIGWFSDSLLTKEVEEVKADTYNNEMLYAKYQYDSNDLTCEFTITRFNSHALDYTELAMFDGTKSGFTSKYWHKIGIVKTNNGYMVSAIANNGEGLSTLGDYDFVILGYTDYPNYSDFVKSNYQVGDNVYFTVDPESLATGVCTIQVSFVKPNIDEDIEKLQNELKMLYGDVEEVTSNMNLVTQVLNYAITWKTSNRDAITSTGKYTEPYVTRTVTLTACVGDIEIYSFTFKAHGKHETSDALATGYIYTPYSITQNAMDVLDIIYPAFLEIDANANWTNLSRMTSNLKTYILPKSKISGTKVVVSVNQSTSGCFSSVAKSAALREKLATNILNFIIELGLDGVDIDWETPSSSEATNFTLLMEAIYKKVKAYDSNMLVTAAIGGGMWAPPKYDLPNSKEYLDYVNLMTYSMATGNGYYQNSLYKSSKGATLVSCSIEESIKIYNDLGVTNNKILVGIPFYTTVQTSSGGPGSKTGSGKSVWYDKMLANYPLSNTMKEYFDEECGVPYRYDPTTQVFISYDNERSIKLKCDYINTLGLAGIMYWQYGQDVNDMLSNAIKEYINK